MAKVTFDPSKDFVCTAECGCVVTFLRDSEFLDSEFVPCGDHNLANNIEHQRFERKIHADCELIRDYEVNEYRKSHPVPAA